jgi:hypothetical protein
MLTPVALRTGQPRPPCPCIGVSSRLLSERARFSGRHNPFPAELRLQHSVPSRPGHPGAVC